MRLTSIGRRIRELREARGLTQEEVGVRAGFGGKYVSEIERGVRDPPISTIWALVENGLGSPMASVMVADAAVREQPRPYNGGQRLPRQLVKVAEDVAALPEAQRDAMIRLVREALALARSPLP